MKKWLHAFTLWVVPPVGAWLIRALGRTLRVRRVGFEHITELYRDGRNAVFVFWHAQQLMMPLVYPGREAYVLISRHRDGELIHRIMARFGLRTVRGSTARGGAMALRRLIQLGQNGADLVVTPDGPRGPRQVAQIGVIQLAQATGLPIVPVSVGYSKKNSSRAGTCFRCLTPSLGRSICAGRRSGFRVMLGTRNSNRNVGRCRKPSIA